MEDKEVQTETESSKIMESLLILDLQNQMKCLTRFMYESAQEHRQNYAAINAQLHLINERLRSPDSNIDNRGSVSNLKIKRELLRCISREKSRDQDRNGDLDVNETLHRECLTEKLEEMVRDMDLNNTNLMDELLDNECLTQDEASNISHISTRKDQIRKLIVLFAKRGRGNFVKFLEVIGRKHQYPHIARELQRIYDLKASEGRNFECLLCVIKRDVDIRDVVDHLCRHQIIDIEFLDLVVSGQSGNQNSLWEIVFSNIDKSSNRKQNIQHLQEALCIKYDGLASKLGYSTPSHLGNHVCSMPVINTSVGKLESFAASGRSVGSMESSIGDRSTTSEVPRKGLPEQTNDETNTNIPYTIAWIFNTESKSSNRSSSISSSDSDFRPPPVSPLSGDSGIESAINDSSLRTKHKYEHHKVSSQSHDIQKESCNSEEPSQNINDKCI